MLGEQHKLVTDLGGGPAVREMLANMKAVHDGLVPHAERILMGVLPALQQAKLASEMVDIKSMKQLHGALVIGLPAVVFEPPPVIPARNGFHDYFGPVSDDLEAVKAGVRELRVDVDANEGGVQERLGKLEALLTKLTGRLESNVKKKADDPVN